MIKVILKDSFLYGVSSILARSISFFLIPIYTAIFSIDDYGTIGVIGSIVGIIAIFMQVGSGNSLQRFYFNSKDETQRRLIAFSGFFILLVSSSLILMLSVSFLMSFDSLLSRFDIAFSLLFLALLSTYLLQFNIYSKEIMRVRFEPRKYLALELSSVTFTAATTLILLYLVEKSLYIFYIGMFIGASFSLVVAVKFLKESFYIKIDKRLLKEMYGFGYPFIFVGLSYWVFQSSDRLMLLEMMGKTDVGLYHVAAQFSSVMTVVLSAFAAAWGPYAMKLYNENEKHKYIFSKVAILWIAFLSMVAVFVSTLGADILRLMTSEEYHVAGDIVPLLAMGVFMLGTTQFSVLGISISKRPELISKYSWTIAIVNIILNLLLIPLYGGHGAALATMLSTMLLTLLYLRKSQSLYYVDYGYSIILFVASVLALTVFIFSVFANISIEVKIGWNIIVAIILIFVIKREYVLFKKVYFGD